MLPRSWWPAWSVPSIAKYRSAVNRASIRFNQDAFAGVQAILYFDHRGSGGVIAGRNGNHQLQISF
jgi:hypothetical protein